jgi:hypothetical protein
MKTIMKSIGKEVAMMLPTMESWSMVGSKGIVVVLPIDTLKWRKDKEYNRYRELFLPKGNKVEWEKVVIPNSGFTISLFPDYEEPYYHYYAKSYSDVHLVKLEHPELAKYPFTIATYMESRNLISLMAKSRNILEGELSGKFCCIHVSGISGICHTVFDIEDPSDKKMEEGKGIGKIISEGKGTTKWKVGYQYVTKTEKTFIYLGDIKGGWLKPAYGSGFGDSLPTGFSCAVNKTSETLALILNTTNLGQDEKDLLNGAKNGWISVFIISYLSYLALNGYGVYRDKLRTIRRSTHSAIEIEKIFEDDKKDMKTLITDFYTTRYPKVTGHELLVKYDDLKEEDKKKLDKEMKGKIESYVKNKRGRSYISTPQMDLSTAQDPEKLLTYIKNNKPSYRYYGSDVYNILDYIGEDKFKELAKTCTFS